MPRVALTPEEVESVRQRASETAMRLFAESGYRAFSIRSLARELGFSPMALYRYFGSKEELLTHVRAEAFRRLADHQEGAVRDVADPRQRIDRLGRSLVEFAIANPEAYAVMFELGQDTSIQCAELEEQGGRAWLPLLEAVTDAVEAGQMEGDPETLANVLFAALHGLVSMHLAGSLTRGRSLDDLVEPLMALLRRGSDSDRPGSDS